MPNITYISYGGVTTRVDVAVGDSVMEGAVQNNIDGLVAECGGSCMCATCHVYVEEQWLPKLDPIDDTQEAMLECTAADRKPNSRLSCQIKVRADLDGLIVHMPETQK